MLTFKCWAVTNLVTASLGHEKLEVPGKSLSLLAVVTVLLEAEVIEVLESDRRQL